MSSSGGRGVQEITVSLTEYEIRALRNSATFMREVLGDAGLVCGCIPEGHTLPPLESAAMKLCVVLMAEGCEA